MCDTIHTMSETTTLPTAEGEAGELDEIERRPAATRGRKRDEERTAAILDAAGELLMQVGFDRFGVQDLAERAGCGTGAIYRRWASKEDLVAEAIRSMPDVEVPTSDDPVADLRAVIEAKFCGMAADPDLLPGMVAAKRAHPAIDAAVRDRYTLEPIRQAIARVLGDDHPRLDTLTELAPALALHRSVFDADTYDPDGLVDDVVALVTDLA